MSYTEVSATATCTIAGLNSTRTAALAVYDYLVNHPDEIPPSLADEGLTSVDITETIECYLSLTESELTIHFSSEECGCYDSEIYDFLCKHFACLQTSPFMTATWFCNDSRDGCSSGVNYYNRAGESVDVEAILTAALS